MFIEEWTTNTVVDESFYINNLEPCEFFKLNFGFEYLLDPSTANIENRFWQSFSKTETYCKQIGSRIAWQIYERVWRRRMMIDWFFEWNVYIWIINGWFSTNVASRIFCAVECHLQFFWLINPINFEVGWVPEREGTFVKVRFSLFLQGLDSFIGNIGNIRWNEKKYKSW